jgi:cytochrome d ubiquinol oxidase subunit II
MEQLWFWLVSVMVAVYVVMDGFDFGAGVLHLFVARSDSERRQVLAAIGPLWDGNEVWLLAAGGAMFLAFPRLLATGFSGFYLAMFMVVWSLILRGIAIEFRSHVQDGLWRAFWDAVFALASTLLPVLLGAALGNVVRGVPLDAAGYFQIPLFTHFRPDNPVGVLDWYTVLLGVLALVALAGHGALFLAWRTDGPVHQRCLRVAPVLWLAVVGLGLVATWATEEVQPALYGNLARAPLAWVATLLFLGGLGAVFAGLGRRRPLAAFLGSCVFLAGLLAATAALVWPVMLPSSLDPAASLTAYNASAGAASLRAGLRWWLVGAPLAVAYFALLFRIHRGKVQAPGEGEGY